MHCHLPSVQHPTDLVLTQNTFLLAVKVRSRAARVAKESPLSEHYRLYKLYQRFRKLISISRPGRSLGMKAGGKKVIF